jgi:glutamate-1-semialdehyde 2,1-aminomutase
MSALRLARGFTGRDKIIKCDGAYHGHADALLAAAGSGAATMGIPGSAGVPATAVRDTIVVPYNDADAVAAACEAHPGQIAALIVEPVAGNMGCVPPRPGYLEALREIVSRAGALLVFDEVMTGFRVAAGGAQERFCVLPDLSCLGKIVGGGLPVGAYGGRREIMERVAPLGPVYQAGTLSGNPLAVAAGLATLRVLTREPPYARLERRTAALADGLAEHARRSGVAWLAQHVGSMFSGFFRREPVWSFADARASDTRRFAHWHAAMLARGIYFAPSPFEAGFLSIAHDDEALERTLAAASEAFAAVAGGVA